MAELNDVIASMKRRDILTELKSRIDSIEDAMGEIEYLAMDVDYKIKQLNDVLKKLKEYWKEKHDD